MQGGATQGIGWGPLRRVYLRSGGEAGQHQSLGLPDADKCWCPFIDANIVEIPSADHPLDLKAVGQVPIVSPAAPIDNAICTAVGVRLYQTAYESGAGIPVANRSSGARVDWRITNRSWTGLSGMRPDGLRGDNSAFGTEWYDADARAAL